MPPRRQHQTDLVELAVRREGRGRTSASRSSPAGQVEGASSSRGRGAAMVELALEIDCLVRGGPEQLCGGWGGLS